VVFAGRIADSKAFADQFVKTSDAYHEATGSEGEYRRFEVRHVDGFYDRDGTQGSPQFEWT